MYVFKLSLIFVFAFTSLAAVLSTRADINSAARDLDAKVTALTSAVLGWNNSTVGFISVSNAENALESSIQSFRSTIQDASPADQRAAVSYYKGTIAPDICRMADAFVQRKADFDRNGVSSTVKQWLASLRSKFAGLGDNLIQASPADAKANASSAKTTVDNCIATAQKSFP